MAIFAVAQPTFQPAMRVISSITNDRNGLVTTTFDHQYIIGTIVRFHIPIGYGMIQLNSLYGPILSVTSTTFTVDIDTSKFDTFVAPTTIPLNKQLASVVPIGEINILLTAAVKNVLPYEG